MTSIRAALSSKPAADDTNKDDYTFEEKEEVDTAENTTDDAVDTEFDPADLLGKILAFVNQVRSSPQARAYFHKLCQDKNLPPLQLLK